MTVEIEKVELVKLADTRTYLDIPNAVEGTAVLLSAAKLPHTDAERVIFEFCQNSGLPNAESLSSHWARLINIRWFQALGMPNGKPLQELVNRHLEALKINPMPVRIVRDPRWVEEPDRKSLWIERTRKAIQDIYGVAETEERFEAVQTVSRIAWNITLQGLSEVEHLDFGKIDQGVLKNPLETAAGMASWLAVEDLILIRKNSFLPLLEMYEEGLMPVGPLWGRSWFGRKEEKFNIAVFTSKFG